MNRRKGVLAAVGAGVMVAALAACGGSGASGNSNGSGSSFLLGTTDTVTALDPAGSYDTGSWNMEYNIYQQLLVIPPNGTTPQGDAAKSCSYQDAKTLVCHLVPGLTFSNGDKLTSSDVKFSFERNIAINNPNGAAVLLSSITDSSNPDHPKLAQGAIETPNPTTVIFHLTRPDTTFIKVLTTAAASIVDEQKFPADKLLPDSKVVGSGPYELSQYKAGEQAVLTANPKYQGSRKPKTNRIFVQYFSDPAPLKQAVSSGQVDIAWRTLSPTDLNSLQSSSTVNVLRGKGSEFRYWVWQMKTKVGKQLAIRQAVAQLIDRQAIAQKAYDGTVQPAYSIVPPGFGGQKDSFKIKYGSPSVAKAKKILQDAHIKTPVQIRLGYTPSHYGPNAVDEADELQRQLNSSGLFKATTADAEWEQYQTLYKQGAYDLFMLGWYPDYLDADDYLSPFLRNGGFYANGYNSPKANSLMNKEEASTNTQQRQQLFGQLQDLVAQDVPLIPSWDGQNVAVAGKDMTGVQQTLDPTYIFRLWMIGKKS